MSIHDLLPSNAVEINGDRVFTTSLLISDIFGKEHKNVLRDIDNLGCSPEFHALNFEPTSYDVRIGNGALRQDRAFNVLKDGFTFLVMGYTGKKAAQFKEAYISRFNAMEYALRQSPIADEPKKPVADSFGRCGTDISAHRVRCYFALKHAGTWMTNQEISKSAKVSQRTARQYTKLFCEERIIERLRISPGHQFRIASDAGQRNELFIRELELAAEVMGIADKPRLLSVV
jgi:Rha family phage regulatory protein